jgi:glycosyltransferase involved in cell wall biosynthesis
MRANSFFSVIITAFDQAEHLEKCIESVHANDSNSTAYEIVLVDGGLPDETVEMLRASNVKIVGNGTDRAKTIGALRNKGAIWSSGNILAFLDADMIVPDNWLQKANEYFQNDFEGALGFVHITPPTAGWVGRTWGNRSFQKHDERVNVDFLPGGNIFVNRKIFEEIHGFNEKLGTGEDKDLTLRIRKAGHRVISVPDITIVHLGYEKNLREFLKKEFWRQGNTLEFARHWGFSFRTLRNPVLSFWHLSLFCAVIFSLLYLKKHITILLILAWLLPSSIITFTRIDSRSPFMFFISFFFLTFLRWNVSGLSLVRQIIKGVHK